ncbi:hypothetical protein [Streptomyces triticisoli]|uniref:hypothetical protein n=1 Tax=Streptomyces triticisoli TaxID=2182797 RepID=UPI000DDBFF6E|nr:hypothetical protein [Streptomyces triticisoli]
MTYSKVSRVDVRFDADELCGARFVPTASVRYPESIEVYRMGARYAWGDVLSCSRADLERWDAAVRDCLDSLSRALEDLYRAHGGRNCKVNLYARERNWTHIAGPRHWPGWQRRLAERSEQAQLAFAAAVQRAEEEYRPVREEIARRLAEHKAQQEARLLARRRKAERRRSVLDTVAAKRVWLFKVAEAGSPILVHRTDVPAARALPDPPAGSSPEDGMTARQLEKSLLVLVRKSGHTSKIRWDRTARAEVERECRALGVTLSFPEWWRAVTKKVWKDTRYGPQPSPPPPPSSSRPSRIGGSGVSGTGGYIGGHGGHDGYSGYDGSGGYGHF